MNENADQIAYWNAGAGAKWVANQARLDRVFMPLTQRLLDAAALRTGEQVLDIGCGCGDLSLRAAALVGETGRVLAVDVSRPMLAHARTRAGLGAPVTWVEADAMTYAFAPAADVMLSRFGVMFFADPPAGLRNLKRGVRPGGRFAFLCWRPRPDVEWMQWTLDHIAPVLPPTPPTIGEPGPFGFADSAQIVRMLDDAGFLNVMATPVDAALPIGTGQDALDEAMVVLTETGPAAVLMRAAEPEEAKRAETLLRQAIEARLSAGQVHLGGACWLYTGRV